MSWFESLSDAAAAVDRSTPTDGACDELIRHVPDSFTLADLHAEVERALGSAESAKAKDTDYVYRRLLATLACLRRRDRIREIEIEASVRGLARTIADAIAPVVPGEDGRGKDDDADLPAVVVFNDDLNKAREKLLNHCRAVSRPGIQALDALLQLRQQEQQQGSPPPRLLDDEVLLTLLALSDDNDDDDGETARTATALLEQQLGAGAGDGARREQFIAETVLQRYLRPLFSRSRPSSITAAGRRAEYADARGRSIPDDTALTKPWKYTDLRAIPAVAWAVGQADDQLIAKHWPLFIPVLLTLADDPSTAVRRRGLLILTDFLAKFPGRTLHDTGLAKVFEDAIFPTLAFLPSLTPEDESVQLLVPAYGALLRLADKQQQQQPTTATPAAAARGTKEEQQQPGVLPGGAKIGLLDKVLREGVFMGYFHAKEHVRIVEVLCQQTAVILNEMGIHAVKHLKDLIPMLSTIMTDPFAPLAPPTLLAAVQALQAVLANCWPRIGAPGSPWPDEIVNALALCWLHLAEQQQEQERPTHADASAKATLARIEHELRASAGALAAVFRTAGADLAAHVAPLREKEPALAALFDFS